MTGDRRQLRRAETIEQILRISLDVMAEQGAAGLSLGEVSRRMGIRPPSLYGYFPSKTAVYDALFARGWELITEELESVPAPDASTDVDAWLLKAATAFARWSLAHPTYTQLMNWRPVPNYRPSDAAYAPAVACADAARARFRQLQQLELLRGDVPLDELFGTWTVLISGVVSQQLANAPEQSFADGVFTALLPRLVEMYVVQFSQPTPPRERP